MELNSKILNKNWMKSQSDLQSQGALAPQQNVLKRALSSTLTLTSLVDCFTILVVYLLVATSFGSEELSIPNDMILPQAEHSRALEKGLVIRTQSGKYFLNDNIISIELLSDKLKESSKDFDSIVIQADKRADYMALNPIVLAGLQAGYKQIKFAVLQGASK